MADEADDILAEDELTQGLEKKRFSGKLIIVAGAGAVIVIALIVFFLFSGGDDHADDGVDDRLDELADQEVARQREQERLANAPEEKVELLFLELGEQVYNLNTGGDGSSFLNVKITLEVDRASYFADLEAQLPRILDEFNTYMRELRPSDLEGAAGIIRLKEELLRRINQTVAPTRVNDILFENFLIQGSG